MAVQEGTVRDWIRPWQIVTAAALVYMAIVVVSAGGDPLALATLGTRFSEGNPQGSEGYDGQFVYYIARDPLHGWQYCDVPAYRYQRILYPLLGRVLALGQEGLLPYSLALINVVALAAGTWLTEQILRRYRQNRWYAVTYGLYAGQLMAARLLLNEPLAQALCQAAVLAAERDRWRWSILLFALAVLTKETMLVFVAGYLLFLLAQRQWRRSAELALGVGLPFLAWQGALWAWLGQPGIGSGGAGATAWEILPFRGLWSVGAINLRVLALLALVMVPLAVIPTLLSLWASGRDLLRGRWHPFTTMLLANAVTMLFLPQSTYREYLAMLRLTTGLMAATILYGAGKRSRPVLNYTLLWLTSLVFLTKEGPVP
jgi:hypothetical protein